MTRALAADDFDAIRERQREIAAPAPAGESCICPPGCLASVCPVHNAEFRQLLKASADACQCPTDHDVHGVYRKVHVPGCLAHVWNAVSDYRHWQACTGPDPLAIGRPERGR